MLALRLLVSSLWVFLLILVIMKKWMLKLVQLVRLILLILSHVYYLVRMLCVDLYYLKVILKLMICLFVAF